MVTRVSELFSLLLLARVASQSHYTLLELLHHLRVTLTLTLLLEIYVASA